ncbi:phasin family protein [Cupriavidus sp. IK-TO18]|uniref:Phasin family protein n=2 Tax=Burkholderiaceae TaxID=119060 RepID=A0A4P7L7J5_9BURK|nr:phasin family protein [Cupriavidus sp. IK-TO18]QBY51644.1 phasin family protein [Cupriavidus oxalaticus]QEZ45120.1 phasin family protein [Cupriavidus oxalaticus]TDF64297.1 phasin family protein [Cupriavidus sp. L7L]
MMTATQAFWPAWPAWPFPAVFTAGFASLQQFQSIQADLAENWRRMAELNLEFASNMAEELRFDAVGMLVEQDPETLYAREIACELPLLGGPLHYASAMLELLARAQQKWIDGWGHLFMQGPLTDWTAGAKAVTDIPSWLIRETPRPSAS